MWSKSITGHFKDFPCTIGYIARIVTIQIPSTVYYRITAKGAKAADGNHFKGGRVPSLVQHFCYKKAII